MIVSDVQMLELRARDSDKKSLYIKIITKSGVEGLYGPIDLAAAVQVDHFFAKRLIGFDALAHEAYWDKMIRASRHSRGSHYSLGLSAVDNALWDLKGRYFDVPVYKLLGGARTRLRAYGSCLGYSQEPDDLKAKVQELKAEGYRHQKWFLNKRGPKAGPEGVEQDAETMRLLREAAGDDMEIMIDASWKWDLQYALAWARKVEQYNPWWIEEPFQSLNIDSFIELSRNTSIPVATGEHFYNRWDAHNFLKRDAIRVVQADPEWCGGITETMKICNIASVHGAHVIPHGHSIHAAMHIVASQPEELCPLVEYLIRKMSGDYYYFEKEIPAPKNAFFELSDRPGFGIEFETSKIEDIKQVHWDKNEA